MNRYHVPVLPHDSFPDSAVPKSLLRLTLQEIVKNLYGKKESPPTLSEELGTQENDVIVTVASQEASATQVADQVVFPGGNLEHTYTPAAGALIPVIPLLSYAVSDDNVLYSTDVYQDTLNALRAGGIQ